MEFVFCDITSQSRNQFDYNPPIQNGEVEIEYSNAIENGEIVALNYNHGVVSFTVNGITRRQVAIPLIPESGSLSLVVFDENLESSPFSVLLLESWEHSHFFRSNILTGTLCIQNSTNQYCA